MTETIIDDFTDKDKVEGEGIPFWNYKEEKSIIGIFARWETDAFGDHIVLQTEKEEIHIPNLTALKTKFKDNANLKIGAKVKITYKDEVRSKKSGRTYADFDVYIK